MIVNVNLSQEKIFHNDEIMTISSFSSQVGGGGGGGFDATPPTGFFLKISETLKAHISGTETDINK